MPETRKDTIARLQQNILLWQGFKPPQAAQEQSFGLGALEAAFPNGVFPTGAIHEFLVPGPESAAASGGFIGGLLAKLMGQQGICLWIGVSRKLFAPALKRFGVEPDRIIFVDLQNEKQALWAAEEALKCGGLAAVVAELPELTFAQSRRLQLAVETSRVTGFILRSDLQKVSSTTCVARWQIASMPSQAEMDIPVVGFPRWQVELLKVRNGNPGVYQIGWSANGFVPVAQDITGAREHLSTLKAG